MKIKFIILGMTAIFFSSCSAPQYIPSSDDIDVNQFGSYITITRKTGADVSGELLAIDPLYIVVLTSWEKDTTNNITIVYVEEVRKFTLQYAKPHQYGWTIPVFSLATISHGFYLLATLPINLIATISVTVGGASSFKYNNMDISYDELKMFARFPQGIPPNIDLKNIK